MTSRLGDPPVSLTRNEILDAAASLIVGRGFGACTMRAVAEKVQIKPGSLYHHFASKEAIIQEILNSGLVMLLDQVRTKLESLLPEMMFWERVEAAIDVHVSCMSSGDMVFMQVYEHLPPVLKRESSAMRKKYARLWFELFREGIQLGEIDPTLDLGLFIPYFLGGLNRVSEWLRAVGADSKDVARLAVTVLFGGVVSMQSPAAKQANVRRGKNPK
jgi:AcrR family transcriptional regulator